MLLLAEDLTTLRPVPPPRPAPKADPRAAWITPTDRRAQGYIGRPVTP